MALLVLRVRDQRFQTRASLAADILVLIAVGAATMLSLLDHQRSFRPSTLLSLFMSALSTLGIARARTFWLIEPYSGVPAAETAAIVLGVTALVLESFRKQPATCVGRADGTSREQFSSFWSRVTFAWLTPTLWTGNQKVICVEDLPALDVQLMSRTLHNQLNSTWQECKYCRSINGRLLTV